MRTDAVALGASGGDNGRTNRLVIILSIALMGPITFMAIAFPLHFLRCALLPSLLYAPKAAVEQLVYSTNYLAWVLANLSAPT